MPIKRSCKICKNEFLTKPFHIKQGNGLYCSRACSYLSRKKGKELPCHICGKMAYKTIRQLNFSKSKLFFCSKSCQTKWRNQEFVGEKHPNWKHGRDSYRSVLGRNNISKLCTLCELKDDRLMAVHHLDRNRTNNKVSNLAWLCHNCHFLVHHNKKEEVLFLKKFNKNR